MTTAEPKPGPWRTVASENRLASRSQVEPGSGGCSMLQNWDTPILNVSPAGEAWCEVQARRLARLIAGRSGHD